MKRKEIAAVVVVTLGLTVWLFVPVEAVPMGTAWTYQGRLVDDSTPADGLYDFQFKLFDDPCTGTQQEGTIEVNDLEVIDGYFTVELDFGSSVFDGDARWLEITIRPGASVDGNDFATLSPRQETMPTPYALYARSAGGDNDWTISGNDMYSAVSGNVGIGTTSPSAKLDVEATSGGAATIGSSFNSAIGHLAIAMGYNAHASGGGSTAMGYNTTASGDYSTAMGHLTIASNTSSTAMGTQTTASGYYSTAMGSATIASNTASTATGYATLADGYCSTAMGTRIKVLGDYSFGIGLQEIAWVIDQDNTMAIMGGKVGIGTTGPEARLDVIASGASETGVRGEHSNGSYGFLGGTYCGVQGESLGVGVLAISHGSGPAISAENTSTGNLFQGTSSGGTTVFKVSNDGSTTMRGNLLIESSSTGAPILELGEGLDYAEGFDVSARDKINAGSVLIIDADNPGKLALSNKAYDTKVAGIVAGGKGLGSGVRLGAGQFDYDVALAGRVYCKVDATDEAIQAGDLLTTSGMPGYAMKAADYMRAQGAILGKAMESLEKGQKGQILVLVTLQ
jgi:hypothetical protein